MTTLTHPPLASILDRLFAEAAAASPAASPAFTHLSAEERERRMESKTDGRDFVADDADHCPDYRAHVRSSKKGDLPTPFGADVEPSMRIA